MNFKPDKYQEQCLRTWFGNERSFTEHLQHMANGLTSEAGEFMSLVDKQIYKPNKEITRAQMLDELGDVAYNVAIGASLFGVTLDELYAMNAEKLKDGHGWIDNIICDVCKGEGYFQNSEDPNDGAICPVCKGSG